MVLKEALLNKPIIGGRAHSMEEVREVCSQGLPFVEISLDDPEGVEKDLQELLAIKEYAKIDYLAHYPNEGNPFDPGSLRHEFVPKIKELLKLSYRLGIRKGTIHFWMDKRWAQHDLIMRKISLLDEMVSYAETQGVVLCIENLSERYDSFKPAFDAIPSLRMTLDIGHGQLLARENTALGFIRNTFERIAHLHVHDNHGGKSVTDDEHLPLGEGIIDYPGILHEIIKKGYDSTVTMEVKPMDMPKSCIYLKRVLAL